MKPIPHPKIQRIKKEFLESKKLNAIRIRIVKHKLSLWDKKLLFVAMGAVGTLLAGFISYQQHLSLTERQYESSINSDMIKLIQDLEKAKTEQQKITPALLLSAYEKDAIQVLLIYLEYEHFGKAVRSALKLILLKERVKKDLPALFYPLLDQTEKIFRDAAPDVDLFGRYRILDNHAETIAELTELGIENGLLNGSFRQELICRINDIKKVMPGGDAHSERAKLLKKLQDIIDSLGIKE